MINDASGAIGSYALQLAKHYGAQVTGVCSTSHIEFVKALGADRVIDYTQEDFTQNGETYDVIFDVLGRSSFLRCKNSLTENGRLLKLEEQVAQQAIELSAEQAAQIEKANPCFRERHGESSRPGELLCADTFYVGRLKGVGKVYLHAVVDTYGSIAFGFLHTSKQPEAAALVLHNDVLPFYRQHGLTVGAILTDNGREFCGTRTHPYELYLALNDIEHRRTQVCKPQTNGFIERFHRTALDEFFRSAFRTTFYETVEALQRDLDTWLVHCLIWSHPPEY